MRIFLPGGFQTIEQRRRDAYQHDGRRKFFDQSNCLETIFLFTHYLITFFKGGRHRQENRVRGLVDEDATRGSKRIPGRALAGRLSVQFLAYGIAARLGALCDVTRCAY